MTTIKIYTDGSCLPHNGNGAFAVVMLMEDGATTILHAAPEKKTNSGRMELRAVHYALCSSPHDAQLLIHCDSSSIVDHIKRLKKGRQIGVDLLRGHCPDIELWEQIAEEVTKRGDNFDITWVKSQGCAGNLAAHRAARGEVERL